MNRHFLVCSLPIGSKQFYRFVRQVMLNRLRIESGRRRYSITTQPISSASWPALFTLAAITSVGNP